MENILIVDDKATMVEMLGHALKQEGFNIIAAHSLKQAISNLGPLVDAVIADLKLPDGEGIELLRITRSNYPLIPVIVITAYGTIEKAVASIKEGAFDFITKPFDIDHLMAVLKKALEDSRLRQENFSMKSRFSGLLSNPPIIGESEAFKRLQGQIRLVSDIRTTILIRGESGTGKELVARAIHSSGIRSRFPFIPVNCAAIPKNLMESELFGHEKGAFTGATETKLGKFEIANRGTIFLDEIGDLDISLQAKLLRVLEYGEFERVGGLRPIKIDVRILAASNKDLEEEVRKGRFREDLFFRLNVFPITIPPLRDRRDDIMPITRYFLHHFAREFRKPLPRISKELEAVLLSHDWKGNVRELRNTIERAMIVLEGGILEPRHINFFWETEYHSSSTALQEASRAASAFVERERIVEALKITGWNKSKAARLLKISNKTLFHKIKIYEIEQ